MARTLGHQGEGDAHPSRDGRLVEVGETGLKVKPDDDLQSAQGVGGCGSDVERGRGTLSKVMLCYALEAVSKLRKEEGVYSRGTSDRPDRHRYRIQRAWLIALMEVA